MNKSCSGLQAAQLEIGPLLPQAIGKNMPYGTMRPPFVIRQRVFPATD
jgi:hypothetical protein